MSNPYLGEIRLFGGNFAPSGWHFCDGSLLPIATNDALFTLLGTTYGGDGQTTFAVPDLRGRVPVHLGQGFVQGQLAGNETVTLTTSQIPGHTHGPGLGTLTVAATSTAGNQRGPGAAIPAKTGLTAVYSTVAPDATMAAGAITGTPTIAASGGGQPVGIMQPSLAISFIICVNGIFPSQN